MVVAQTFVFMIIIWMVAKVFFFYGIEIGLIVPSAYKELIFVRFTKVLMQTFLQNQVLHLLSHSLHAVGIFSDIFP